MDPISPFKTPGTIPSPENIANSEYLQRIDDLNQQIRELSLIRDDYEEILEHATEVIFKLDTEGNFLFVSSEFERMLQISDDEIRGCHFTSIIHPADLPICIETFRILAEHGRADSSIDFRVRQKNGNYKWLTCSAISIFDDSGKPMHTIGLAHELTRLHEALEELTASEKALRVSEERYRSLFEALAEGTVLIDKTMTVIAANRSAKNIFGLPLERLPSMASFNLNYSYVHEDGTPFPVETHPTFISLTTGKSFKDVVMGVKGENGWFKWISLNTEPIFYSDVKDKPDAVVASFTDITQSKKDREELIRNQDLLALQSERYIAATRAMAQAVVDAQEKERAEIGVELHDNVNQILSTVRLYLDLAQINGKDRDNLIKRSSAGIADAVSEIRKICHSLVPASLNDLGLAASIEDLLESVKVASSIKTEFYQKGDIANIEAKSKLVIFRIIQEQVTNVLKHSQATSLVIELVNDEKFISLTITDNGKGFENEAGKTKKGVGLYNIANRAELLNGKVNMITSPGNGCKLNILIPI